MPTYTLPLTKYAILRVDEKTRNDHTSPSYRIFYEDQILMAFEKLADAHKYEEVTKIEIKLYGSTSVAAAVWYGEWPGDFDENTANYVNSAHGLIDHKYEVMGRHETSISLYNATQQYPNYLEDGLYAAKNTLVLDGYKIDTYPELYLRDASRYPRVVVTTTGSIVTAVSINKMSPTGRVNRYGDTLFSWVLTSQVRSYAGESITSATLKWRAQGSQSWNRIENVKNKATVTAGTFPSGTIEWQVDATLDNGYSLSSEIETIDTTEPAPTVAVDYPDKTIINASEEVTLQWTYSVATESAQKAFELEKSTDGTNWQSLAAKTTSSDTTYSIAPGAISSGDFYWRVKAYNNDDVSSEWAEAHVTAIASPSTPLIQFTEISPRVNFRWETTEQQGYQIRIDGVVVESKYGTKNSYQYEDWLSDGNHTIEVRVQNSYGLWSEWGAASANIQNVPGEEITLTAEGNALSWTGEYDGFIIYRNSVPIATVTGNSFADVFSNGFVSYQARGFDGDTGNYTLSNSINSEVDYENLTLIDAETGSVIDLGKSARQTRQINIVIDKDITFTHYSGHEFPAAERGNSVDRIYTFEFAFLTDDPRRTESEKMVGKTVILHNPYDETTVGVISSLRKTEDEFICSYTATLTRTEYNEVEINARLQLPD